MSEWLVELSAENLDLAKRELAGASEAIGGRLVPRTGPLPRFEWVELGGSGPAQQLAQRLAMSRRIVRPWPFGAGEDTLNGLEREAVRDPRSASFRPVGRPTATGSSKLVGEWARAWKNGGGGIDLVRPQRRFLFLEEPGGVRLLGEELAAVDRRALERHRMPNLPFQRPVSLRPRLARAAANLGAIRSGDLVVDPFVGTGALLLEAALLGARVCGIDRDAEMVRGAVQNFAHLGTEAERMIAADAAEASESFAIGSVSTILTDPPYGRASTTAGEGPEHLVRRVLSAWSDRISPRGRIVLVTPGGPDPLGSPWVRTVCVRDRVHRSLTREFRVYERDPAGPGLTRSV